MTASRTAREFDFELPVGYTDEDGRVHRVAVLRKMTGHEESQIADRKLRQNGGRLITELLMSCLKRIGDLSPVSREIVTCLTSADRNYLLLQLRKITFGNELEASYTCPSCGESNAISEDLDGLPVQRVNGSGPPEIVVDLEDGYEDNGGAVYTRMVFRLPVGSDEERTAPAIRDNAPAGMNSLLARCLVSVADLPSARREALGTKLISDLTLGDRARIDKAFRKDNPGVDMRRDIECTGCGKRFKATLDLTGFFSPR